MLSRWGRAATPRPALRWHRGRRRGGGRRIASGGRGGRRHPRRINWVPVVHYIKGLPFWRILVDWLRPQNIKPHIFINTLIKGGGWKQIERSPIWPRFVDHTQKIRVNIRKDVEKIKQIVVLTKTTVVVKNPKTGLKRKVKMLRPIHPLVENENAIGSDCMSAK